MCIFSAPVKTVAGTCIIVGKTQNGNIRLVYSNKVACDNGNVMVLPIDSDNIKLIMLDKKYESLGKDIADGYRDYYAFLNPSLTNSFSKSSQSVESEKVAVIKYGPYDVSLTKDLRRVDWNHFGGLQEKDKFYDLMYNKYKNYNFLIAKIRRKENNMVTDIYASMTSINNIESDDKIPICYDFKPKQSKIMIPTFHIHDGKAEAKPEWDHYVMVLNGIVENYDEDQSIVNKQHMKQFFNQVNNLFIENQYEPLRYVGLMRVSRFSEMPNIDMLCAIDNTPNKIIKDDNVPKSSFGFGILLMVVLFLIIYWFLYLRY